MRGETEREIGRKGEGNRGREKGWNRERKAGRRKGQKEGRMNKYEERMIETRKRIDAGIKKEKIKIYRGR